MRSNPFLWIAKHAAGFAAGWSLASGEPWRQTLAFTLVWLLAVAITFDRDFRKPPRPIVVAPGEPSRN